MISPKNPIVEEVRAARDAHATRFNYNLKKIVRDLRKQDKAAGRTAAAAPNPKSPTKASKKKRRVTRLEKCLADVIGVVSAGGSSRKTGKGLSDLLVSGSKLRTAMQCRK